MRYVAFVRAVMVGREGLHRDVLLDAFADAGAAGARSHLATGNVSIDFDARSLPRLVGEVEAALTRVVGRDIDIYVRSLDDLRAVPADVIFGRSPFEESGRMVTYFHEPPTGLEIPSTIQGGRTALVALNGVDLYSTVRVVDGREGAPGGRIEKLTGQRVTTRGWSTIQKIMRAHSSPES